MTSNNITNESSCQNCASLRAQLEQKEAIVAKYQKIVQSQNELLHDLTQKNSSGGSSTHKKIGYHGSRRITSSPCSPNAETIKNSKHYGKQGQYIFLFFFFSDKKFSEKNFSLLNNHHFFDFLFMDIDFNLIS